MEKRYIIIIYDDFNNLSKLKRDKLIEIFYKYKNRFYIKKSKRKKENIILGGISNIEIVLKIESELNNLFYYEIGNDEMLNFFKDEKLYELYIYLSKELDLQFKNYYFSNELDYIFIYHYIVEIYKYINKLELLSISHLSHVWGFFINLKIEKENKEKLYRYFNENEIKYLKKNMEEYDFKYVDQIINLIENKLLYDKNFNFFSPRKLEDIISDNSFSSELHKETMYYLLEKKDNIIKNKYMIFNVWFLNLIYEKMILLNISIFDKYMVNFSISKYNKEYDIVNMIEKYLKTGLEF